MGTETTMAAALGFAVVATGVVLFQVALALGAPWGEYAMGGRFPGRFPTPMRVAATIQAAAIAILGFIVVADAGVLTASAGWTRPWLIWLPVLVSGVALVLNAITPSAGERRIWVPVTLLMLLTSLVVAVR